MPKRQSGNKKSKQSNFAKLSIFQPNKYKFKKNRKGSYIHFKIKARGSVISELEKNESIDKKLLRYLTVKVKKFDLETNYFSKKEENDKKESLKS